jgi:hypothetical protein
MIMDSAPSIRVCQLITRYGEDGADKGETFTISPEGMALIRATETPA